MRNEYISISTMNSFEILPICCKDNSFGPLRKNNFLFFFKSEDRRHTGKSTALLARIYFANTHMILLNLIFFYKTVHNKKWYCCLNKKLLKLKKTKRLLIITKVCTVFAPFLVSLILVFLYFLLN